MLFAFFLPSSLLSRIGRARKARLTDTGKHGPRDAAQVLANGGVAAVCAVLAAALHQPVFAAAFAGAFAAASSDTWGTEIGTLSNQAPRSVLTWRKIPAGLSGGVTLTGSAAEIAGAFAVAAAARSVNVGPLFAIACGGICGAIADSILGAYAQELRYCPECKRQCETDPHACGTATTLVRGFAWMTNDAVNACATVTGALAAAALRTFFPSME